MNSLFLTAGRRLRLLQEHDHHTQWWSLDEIRFCTRCQKPVVGNDIRISLDDDENAHFQCPTFHCPGTLENFDYPNLHL